MWIMRGLIIPIFAVIAAVSASADEPQKETPPATPQSEKAAETPPAPDAGAMPVYKEIVVTSANKMSEGLVYSVDRTPERIFDTSRAVEVITREEIERKGQMTEIADLLREQAGFFMTRNSNSGASAIIRGLGARQILVMIDGVKINQATWRSYDGAKEQFNLIDPNEIERIEIVRGTVSVLGTEALGGVVNIITRRGPPGGERFGGTYNVTYGSADKGLNQAVEVYGQTDRLRYVAGASYMSAKDLKAGDSSQTQAHTDYKRRAGHVHADYFVSELKTLSANYRAIQKDSIDSAFLLDLNISSKSTVSPIRMQMATVAYQDLTVRKLEDSLNVTAYWNRQDDGWENILRTLPNIETVNRNADRMMGLNLELGRFIGSHHVLYGYDYSTEKISSRQSDENRTTGAIAYRRGDYIDGSTYRTSGFYLNDHFDISKWATISAGVRYGTFATKGKEVLPLIGEVDLDSSKSALTSSVHAVVHVRPSLNVIGSYVRGFRAPNLEDMSAYAYIPGFYLRAPNPDAGPERMKSYELGTKFENKVVAGSIFYFRNDLSDLLQFAVGGYNGQTFLDNNNNGRYDFGDTFIFQNQNLGKARISGYEVDGRVTPVSWLTVWGNYMKTNGENTTTNQTLDRIQPRFGTVGVRAYAMQNKRFWSEALMHYASAYEVSFGPTVVRSDGFHVYTVRAGMEVNRHLRVTVGMENLTDAQYRYLGFNSALYEPGRQFVISTSVGF